MNLTIGNTTTSILRSVKAQYITAACGLALALGALTGLGAWRDGGAAAPRVAARASTSVPYSVSAPESAPGPRDQVIVIVGSQQQASDQAASLYQDLAPAWYAAYSFVVVTNAEEEAWVHYLNAEASRADPTVSVQLVDLRSRKAFNQN